MTGAATTSATTVPVEISLEHVSRSYRRGGETVLAVDDVSLRLTSGELVGLVGPSGSGKTTLLNLVMGEDEPDSGVITGRPKRPTWRDVAIVSQQLGLLDELTVRENVTLPVRLGAPAAGDVEELMARLEIAELADRFPEETSLGQQQRTAIARALVVEPAVVIVDEPTSHQDEVNVEIVAAALVELASRGALVVVATHDDRLVDRCDRVIRLAHGRIVDS